MKNIITGDASDYEKFLALFETIRILFWKFHYIIWSHLELKRFFGIDTILSKETAEEIWEKCPQMKNYQQTSLQLEN